MRLVHLRVPFDVLLREVDAEKRFAHLDGNAVILEAEIFALQRPVVSRLRVVDEDELVMQVARQSEVDLLLRYLKPHLDSGNGCAVKVSTQRLQLD